MRLKDAEALPAGARLRLGTTRFRPGLGSLAPVFSPDGERMLVEDSERTPLLHILEARSGRRLETLRSLSHELGRVLALSWTPQGIRTACQLYGGRPALLEYAHSRVRELEAQGAAWADDAAFSADGQCVAMLDHEGAVRVWNTSTCRMIARARSLSSPSGGPDVHKALAMSADGRHVAWSTGDTRIHLYDVASRQLRPPLAGHSETVGALAFSPDGTRLASAALFDEPRIRIWDVERGQPLLELPALGAPSEPQSHGAPCPSFAFIGPGARLVWLDGEALRTQELSTGASTSLSVGAVRSQAALCASPDGTCIVAREAHALRTWNLDTGLPDDARDSHSQPVRSVALSADGTRAATSDDSGSVRIWDVAFGQSLGQLALSSCRGCLRFSPDGRWLAVGTSEGQVHLWSCGEGRVLHSFPTHPARLEALVFSPDSLWLATCPQDSGDICVWSVPGGKRRRVLESHCEHLTALDCSPDNQWLASGSIEGAVCVFSVSDGRLVHTLQAPDSSVHHVRFFPDSQRLLTVGLLDSDAPDDGPGQPMLHLWHAPSGKLLGSRRARSHQVDISPDGRQLLYVPWRNPALCVEEAMTGAEPRTLRLVPEPECHAFSASARVWLTGHPDCTALVWELDWPMLLPPPSP